MTCPGGWLTALRKLKTNETARRVEVIWEISQSGIQQALCSSPGVTLRGQTADDSPGFFSRFGVRSEARIVLRESWTAVMRANGAGGGGSELHMGKVD